MTLVGAYVGTIVNSATNRDRFHTYGGFLGRWPDFAFDFAPDTSFAAMQDASIPHGWRKFDVRRLVITMPLMPVGFTLADVASGALDSNYTNLMTNYQADGFQEGVIRLGHEFNGTWYRWRADNGNEQIFVDAWRRVVTLIRAATHNGSSAAFLFDWCPTIGTPSNCNNEAAYPGDDYVDIIGMDVYNQWFPGIVDNLSRWNAIRTSTYGLNWHAEFAAAHGKPISFPEWGTGTRNPPNDGNIGGDDPMYVRNMAAWIRSHNVSYHSYWDFAGDIDARISNYTFPKSARAYHTSFSTWGDENAPSQFFSPPVIIEPIPGSAGGGVSLSLNAGVGIHISKQRKRWVRRKRP